MNHRTFIRAVALSASIHALWFAAPASAADTIKVGILHSLSGTMAIRRIGAQGNAPMTIARINASGEVIGKQLEPVVVDPAWN